MVTTSPLYAPALCSVQTEGVMQSDNTHPCRGHGKPVPDQTASRIRMQAHVYLLHKKGRTVLGYLDESKLSTIEQVFMRHSLPAPDI